MTILATVRPASRAKLPRLPLKSPISITPAAQARLRYLYEVHRPPFPPSSSSSDPLPSSSSSKINEISTTSKSKAAPKESLLESVLKITVRTKGCSGTAYALDWTRTVGARDETITFSPPSPPATPPLTPSRSSSSSSSNSSPEAYQLVIDSRALFSLLGSQMDYVESKLGGGFVFDNPNVKETCGCGLSFTVDENEKNGPE